MPRASTIKVHVVMFFCIDSYVGMQVIQFCCRCIFGTSLALGQVIHCSYSVSTLLVAIFRCSFVKRSYKGLCVPGGGQARTSVRAVEVC